VSFGMASKIQPKIACRSETCPRDNANSIYAPSTPVTADHIGVTPIRFLFTL
jgi:hypothetical protein